MDITSVIGIVAGACTALSLLPQVIKTLKEKKVEDVSVWMLIVLLSGLVLWIIYGIKKEDLPILITNSVSLLINLTMLVLRIKYKK